jgi:hypothetical protein
MGSPALTGVKMTWLARRYRRWNGCEKEGKHGNLCMYIHESATLRSFLLRRPDRLSADGLLKAL